MPSPDAMIARLNSASGRPIGRTGVSVSALGFGTAPLGNLYAPVDEEAAQAAIDESFNGGVRYFDTAPFYGFGLSEERLGRGLAGRPRSSFTISSKVGRRITADERPGSGLRDSFAVTGHRAVFDYSRDGVQRSFESSVKRLGIEHIDILLLHDVGKFTHGERHETVLRQALEEALPAMAELRAAGAVGAIGVGVNEQAVCLELLPRFDLDCIMLAGRYTLFEQHASAEVMAEAQRREVKVLIAGPYTSGLLGDSRGPGSTYNYQPADAPTLERARAIYAQCAVEGVEVGAAALQLPLAHPAVASVVAGLRSRAEVLAALDRLAAAIPPSLWQRLRRAGLLESSAVVARA